MYACLACVCEMRGAYMRVCVCVCVVIRACVRICVRACVGAFVHARMIYVDIFRICTWQLGCASLCLYLKLVERKHNLSRLW